MADAISYRRFSSPKQGLGDSLRRQTDLAENYCKRYSLRLVDTYLDAGLSAFTGEHLSDGGRLRALLDAARAGKFERGTVLIIESLDRLTRGEISTAVRLFLDILDTGLVIVTLIDGEQVFTKERVDSDMSALIIPIVILSRANNEARSRKERITQARQAALKRAREQKIPITAQCPAWLTVAGRRRTKRFVVDDERVRIVEKVFRLAASGMGQNRITTFLNEQNVPTLTDRPRWRTAMVAHLLTNPAVLGVFHPRRLVFENGRSLRKPDAEGPIEDYFPPIITKELFEEVRAARLARLPAGRRRTEKEYSNLLPCLGRCAICGGTLEMIPSGSGTPYLRCIGAKYAECGNNLGFPYAKLEPVLLVLDQLTEVVAQIVTEKLPSGSAARRVLNLTARVKRAKDELNELVASVSHASHPRLFAANARMEQLHAEVERQEQALTEAEREAHHVKFSEQGRFLPRFKTAKQNLGAPDRHERNLARGILAAELRRLVNGVVLDTDRTATVHMKEDVVGYRVVYELRAEGLQGAHVRFPDGLTGFIESAILRAVIGVRDGDSPEGACARDQLMRRIQILSLARGNWQAVMPDPFQMVDIVSRAEKRLEN